ncbi:MAG: hypothetical protein K9N09_00650 [Candidatus Cloacimonetes bacterium]|nr:hypothetical protein [Candidatus Cloacimonadota bacterium]MCF7813076.1 hypothetical protein [Candidatus Cloacimonadota bacterium]MCF7867183.1 hypothetical protein [Candidatus Cloacimonadota bacterium]MCF7882627.1 hypothetical protein [Candidatus Cloacimonadota bacterium]
MKTIIFSLFILLCWGVIFANPLEPAVLSELYFEDGSWTLEIYDYYQIFGLFDLNGAYLTTSAGTAYFNNGITFNSNMVFVVNESDLQEPLAINPDEDSIIFGKVPEIFDQISFGYYVNPPDTGQSLARLAVFSGPPMYYESFLLVKENQPSLGSNPFTVSSYGTFTGYVFDSLMNPVENVQLEHSPGLGYNFPEIVTNEAGYFEAELPGINYNFNIHLAALASLPDTIITIEPDSLNYYEFVFEDYVHSDDHEIEFPTSYYQLTNFPNPFNPTTEISFNVTQSSVFATVEIFNSKGQKIKTIECHPEFIEGYGNLESQVPRPSTQLRMTQAGNKYSATWNGTNSSGKPCPSGVYLYKLVSGEKELAANKMLLLR